MTRIHLQRAALACAAALAIGALASSAQAQPDGAMSAVRKACGTEYSKHCSRVRPDGREALACLEQQIEKLSQKCQDALFAIMPPPTRVTNVPGPSGGQQDTAAPPPPQHEAESAKPPSTPRAAAAPSAKAQKAQASAEPAPLPRPSADEQRALRQYCRKDYQANCRGIPPSSPDAIACLQSNLGHLSRACERVVNAIMPPEEQSPIVSAPPPRALPERRAARDAVEPPPPPRDDDIRPQARGDDVPPPGRGDEALPRERDDAALPAPGDDAAPPPRADYAPAPPRRDEMPPARAERAPGPGPIETGDLRACGRDFAALCPSLRPGSSAAIACLQRRTHALTPQCRKAMRESMSEAPPPAPRASIDRTPVEEAAPPPRQSRARHPATVADLARACRSDLYRHCRSVRPGSGREFSCLIAHRNVLTFGCRTALRSTLR